MQNYQQSAGYQRPGSTASFAGQPGPPPPPYGGASQGYQTASPQSNSQWAPPPQTNAPAQQQSGQTPQPGNWGQQQQQAPGGYNPGTYGAMPGGYGQIQQQQQDQPPPPPPKPHGFAASVQQQAQHNAQSWGQQQHNYQAPQQNAGYPPQSQQGSYGQQGQQGQHGQYQQQGGYQQQGAPQQQYNHAAPPPSSQTPGGSYFPPSQGRPGSIYGADQMMPASPAPGHASHSTVLSPTEQQPAYIPPSLTGKGVQSYIPANTNPMPGVYVPPPPDIPAWQQASHAPLQGGNKKFKYTKPTVDPSLQGQGYQPPQQTQYAQQSAPPQTQQPYGQSGQGQFQPQHPHHQGQMQPGQFVQPNQPLQQQFGHPGQQQDQSYQHQPPQYNQHPSAYPSQQPPQQYRQQGDQWQPTPPADQGYVQQQPNAPAPCGAPQQSQQQPGWQPGHHAQGSIVTPQPPHGHGQSQDIEAPKPLGRTGTAPPEFFNQTSPQSPAVSPVHHRQSMRFSSQNEGNLGRTGSVSSIALDAIRNRQSQAAAKTGSPAPSTTQKLSTPPPGKESGTAFSALGMGGPSDWEHFGNVDEEIDDEEFFGAKKEEKEDQAHSASVELPGSVPSPPPAAEWPTPEAPVAQPAPLNIGLQRRETFQPTPPPKIGSPAQRPPSQPPQGGFVIGSGVPKAYSPQPTQKVQPPPNQHEHVLDDGRIAPPLNQSTPVQQQYPPAPLLQNYHPSQSSEAPLRYQTPVQLRHQTPVQQQHAPPQNTFAMGDASWGATQQSPNQPAPAFDVQAHNERHTAELRLKDDMYERLKAELEKENAERFVEIERLNAALQVEKRGRLLDGEKMAAEAIVVKSHAEDEKRVLKEQIASMRTAADQAKNNLDLLTKEKDMAIERLNEDAEGRDDVIKERDELIASLKRQLEAEKAKELPQPPKPTAADLIPDINPWYVGSLERYINMLRAEASEPQVEDKIKVFTGFLKEESAIRGLDYPSAPPAPPVQEQHTSTGAQEPSIRSRGASVTSIKRPDMHVQVPQQAHADDEPGQYSPGGRPIFQRKPTIPTTEGPSQRSSVASSGFEQSHTQGFNQSTTILTPTSSADDDFNKTPTPVHSPPEEPKKYKAYVPSGTTATATHVPHRASVSYATSPTVAPLQRKNTLQNDEIFFGGDAQAASKLEGRPTTSSSAVSDIPVPAPLFTPKPPGVSSAPPVAKKSSVEVLNNLLPKQIFPAEPNPSLEAIRDRMKVLPSDFSYIATLTTTWEKAAALTRKKNDTARHQRQEESEDHTNQLFEDNEISYQDIGDIEDEFKEKERELKAKEDRDEYKSYVHEVFDKVYDGLQADIKALMDANAEAESLLHSSVSGIRAIEGGDAPTTKASLAILKELNSIMEDRHERVVQAVAERDKKYKKTEVQPLYAAGDIKKMKQVEKHFENAEKMAAVTARDEKADRLARLVKLAEEVVISAVGAEQGEIDGIVKAVEQVRADEAGREHAVDKAGEVLEALLKSSKDLLTVFNKLEIELNEAVLEAEIAQAKVEGKDARRIGELQEEMREGERRLKDEFERKVGVLDRDAVGWWKLLKEKSGPAGGGGGGVGVRTERDSRVEKSESLEKIDKPLSEEEEKKRRLQAALEEAKRRNGER
ncbi:hypothetical protein K491DRAFT_776465 [Lophiostoma macrostomum CBS 122681]|uniref:Uncharacterized protein n=1 Tax=Lophiostoma macrostomum CBS 122681 TaxID=1314788 RepID=A0A6A6TH59_9PLEO|nr:hypothetical protein K491DRAFT_776465 [Lophiostoma macrostomum CBS 122681]